MNANLNNCQPIVSYSACSYNRLALHAGTHWPYTLLSPFTWTQQIVGEKIVNLNKWNRDRRYDFEKKKLHKQEVIGMVNHITI